MKKMYCEHGALNQEIKKLSREGKVKLIYLPYDFGSNTKKINNTAVPSAVAWDKITLSWEKLKHPFSEFIQSDKFDEIKSIIGGSNKNDILHVDSAYKSKCICLITRDRDILDHSIKLEEITGIKFYNPDKDISKIKSLIYTE